MGYENGSPTAVACTSHRRTVPSVDEDATNASSGEKPHWLTASEWPGNAAISAPVAASQRTTTFPQAEAIRVPSREKDATHPSCRLPPRRCWSVASSLPPATSQSLRALCSSSHSIAVRRIPSLGRGTAAEARRRPSGEKTQRCTAPRWPARLWSKRPFEACHTLTAPSWPPEAMRTSSGEKAHVITGPSCPASSTERPRSSVHTFSVPSALAVTSRRPSGEKSQARIFPA